MIRTGLLYWAAELFCGYFQSSRRFVQQNAKCCVRLLVISMKGKVKKKRFGSDIDFFERRMQIAIVKARACSIVESSPQAQFPICWCRQCSCSNSRARSGKWLKKQRIKNKPKKVDTKLWRKVAVTRFDCRQYVGRSEPSKNRLLNFEWTHCCRSCLQVLLLKACLHSTRWWYHFVSSLNLIV